MTLVVTVLVHDGRVLLRGGGGSKPGRGRRRNNVRGVKIRMTLARPQLKGLCIRALTVRKYKRRIVLLYQGQTQIRSSTCIVQGMQPGASTCTNGTQFQGKLQGISYATLLWLMGTLHSHCISDNTLTAPLIGSSSKFAAERTQS